MATNIPRDPNSAGDDSHIFRRAKPKPPDARPPEEPTDLLDFGSDDDEDALGGLPQLGSGDSPSVIVRRGYREGSSVNLGGAGHTPGESGSSIFAHAESLAPSAPGSGWFDSIPPVAKSIPAVGDPGDTHVVDDLFAGLDQSDSVAVPVSGWQEQQATNSVTESEVIRAFDNLSSRDVTKRLGGADDALDYDATQLSGSHIFPDSSASEIGFGDSSIDFDPSGVDLLNPERADSERLTGPRSSIFGAPSNKEHTELDLADAPTSGEDISESMLFNPPPDGGSSIFGKSTPQLAFPSDADEVAFPEAVPGEGDQASGMVDWATKPPSGSMQPSMAAALDADADVDPFTDEIETLKSPAPKKRSGPVGTSGAGAVVAPAKPRDFEEIDDEPIRAPKREPARVKTLRGPERKSGGGGILGWVGGGAVGLLVGAGAFAGLQFGGVLPGAEATKPAIVQNAGPSAELTALEVKQEELNKELLVANEAAGRADAEKTTLEQSIKTARADLKTAKDDAVTSKKSLVASGEKLTLALAEVKSAKDDADAAQKEATKAAAFAKEAGLATDAAKAETKLAKANADKYAADLDAANKAVVEKTKLSLDAEAVAAAAQKKLQSSEAGLGSIVKDLKANKLIDDALDAPTALALLPEVFKKLGTLAMSPDAKKAAEALLASKKDLETAQTARKVAESAKVEAEAKVLAAKKETDAAKKETDAKVLAAVDKATADAKKSLADADAEKVALAAKQKADAAALQTAHAQQLAEARQGGAIQITPAEVLNQDRAARDYHAGVQAFQAKKYAPASAALESAVKLDPADARYWYYLGLTLWELGRATEARAAFQKGSDLEARGKPNTGHVGEALERIQGEARKELMLYRR